METNIGRIYEPATCSTTDEKGHYTLDRLAPRAYSVSAMADGFVAQSAAQHVVLRNAESRAGVDIVLQPGGAAITGVVVDAMGGPIPHATVRGEQPEATPPIVIAVEADDEGRFKLSFPPGGVVLAAAAAAYAPAHAIAVAPSVNVRLVLIPGGRVRGVVVSAADGQPVQDVEVRALPVRNQGSPLFGLSRSDPTGGFDIRGLEPGAYTLVATGDGWRGEGTTPIGLSLGATVENVRIVVSPAAQVQGRVVFAADGHPCEQGLVMLGPPDPRQPPVEENANSGPPLPRPTGISADIEAQGVVKFGAVPPGHYYVTVGCGENVLKEGPRVLDVQTKPISKLDWKVGPGLSLSVVTVDELDRPLPRASFSVRLPAWRAAQKNMFIGGTTDASGRYELRGTLYVGTYEVDPVAPFEAQPVRVELREGADPVEAKLRIAGSASIAAFVHAGEPVDGLAVFADPVGSAADAGLAHSLRVAATAQGKGRYWIGPLKPGRYELSVEDGVNPRVRGGTFVLTAGESVSATVELDRGAQIRGHVVDDDGVAIADAWVSANADGSDGPPGSFARRNQRAKGARSLTNADGEFVLDGIATGNASYTVRAELSTGGVGQTAGVSPGEQDVSIVVPSPGSLAGNVVGGCEASTAFVTAVNTETGQRTIQQVVGSEGAFLLQGVGPGHVKLRATCPNGGGTAAIDVDLAPKQKAAGLRLVPQRISIDSLLGAAAPPASPLPGQATSTNN